MGLTFDQFYATHGDEGIDPFTGQRDRLTP